jgi:hypothetical protein
MPGSSPGMTRDVQDFFSGFARMASAASTHAGTKTKSWKAEVLPLRIFSAV